MKTCQGVLCALSEADKLLAALHHQRISPRRLHQLFRCVLRLSELRTGSAASLAGLSNPSSSAVPAYLSECLLRASPDGLLKAASKLLACMNSTAAGEDDLVNIFTATYEANYPELAALRADLAHALQEMDDELNLIRKVLNNQSQVHMCNFRLHLKIHPESNVQKEPASLPPFTLHIQVRSNTLSVDLFFRGLSDHGRSSKL